ncbi:MAG: 5-methylcytosine-specific restriction endonuclease system specificity protein McrC [Thermoguttaceae bacterium]|nr:5-methylcytosine-specific restriction endonuclease system specificity protein McrC [Thermoguttaceae bacterium]
MTSDKGILIKNIYYMLSYAFQILKQEDYKQVAGESFEKIHDLFAEILLKGISRQIKQGLYREYVPASEELPVLRGKLNLGGTICLKVQQKQKLACDFDEFSEDNLYNRILKLTIYCLSRTPEVEAGRRMALKKLLVLFSGVRLIQPEHITWNRLIYKRSNHNYELLLNICFFLLNGMLQTDEDGNYKLLSFSDEHMERLFERFILEYYRQHHPELKPDNPQIAWNHSPDAEGKMLQFLPRMQTDIVLKKEDKKLIIDAKYYSKALSQHFGKNTLRSIHMYQIFAYVQNMDIEHTGKISGLLLYAKTDEDVFPNCEPAVISGNPIGAKTLDLNQEFSQISQQLESLIEIF